MSWVTIFYSMTGASCLSLALIYGFAWWQQPHVKSYFLFALAALGTAVAAGFEMVMLRTDSPALFSAALRWGQIDLWVIAVSLAGFVRLYLCAGRTWLFVTMCALRTLALALNFVTGDDMYHRVLTGVRSIPFLGEQVSVGVGIANPWMLVAQLSTLLLVAFVADASITAWRRGEQRRALIVGGSIIFFLLAAVGETAAIFWGLLWGPTTLSWFFLGIVVAMSYELSSEAVQASKLASEVRDKEQQMALSAHAASAAAERHRAELAHLSRTASLGEISSGLAHELKQPLTSILINAQAAALLLGHDRWDAEELRGILQDIITDDKRATEIIDGLRMFLAKGEFQHHVLATNDLIQDVLKLMRHDLTSRSIRVITHLAPDLPAIRGDRVQLQQVLVNLILNARDAMAQVALGGRAITITSRRPGPPFIEISVSDTGGGFPQGAEEKLFEPYYSTKPLGLGLGLSLSRSIISAHDGRLWAEQSPLSGAIFHCVLPEWTSDGERSARPAWASSE